MGVLNSIYDNTRMHGNFKKKECVIDRPVEAPIRPAMVTKMEKIIEDDAKNAPHFGHMLEYVDMEAPVQTVVEDFSGTEVSKR